MRNSFSALALTALFALGACAGAPSPQPAPAANGDPAVYRPVQPVAYPLPHE